ncbi:MAG TPA: hypothetical protein PLY30_03420, partial [Candidatus Omnitrophota bacterium]|nr:hypothetical protein [Candidatus Omnitrophota bacterium]
MDLIRFTLKEGVEFAKKEGAQPLLDAFTKRAAELNPGINAFLDFDNHIQPRRLDKSNLRGWSGSLYGAPVSSKDNI